VPFEADEPGLAVVETLFDSLTAYDDRLEVIPAAAVSWTSNEDASAWTFTLRDGALFHDGSPVTSADFKYAWEQAVTGDGSTAAHHLRLVAGFEELRAGEAGELTGVQAPDPRTLTVALMHPYADFPALVGHPALGPVPAARWEADPDAFRVQPIGNGPFRASEPWARGRFIRAARFDRWRNAPRGPFLDEVLFQVLDAETAYVAFQQGRLDVSPLPDGALEQAIESFGRSLDEVAGSGVRTGPTTALYLLAFNVAHPPFDDPEVRRAVSLAIDRDAMTGALLEGNVDPARAFAAPSIPGGRPGSCSACQRDVGRAREIFAERGITRLTLEVSRGGGHERVARLVRDHLAEAGVTLAIRQEEFTDYLSALENGEAGFFRFGWVVEYPTLDDALVPLLHSRGERNYARYADPEVDALLDQARATVDARERARLYQAAEDLAVDRDQVVVPLFRMRHRLVVSDRVDGLRLDPMGRVDFTAVRMRSDGS
jgi:oligopeptide transport system substrate-binding protein